MENTIPSAPLLPGHGPKPPKPEPLPPEEETVDEPDMLNEHVTDPGDPDGIVAAEERQAEARRQATASQGYNPVPPKKKRRWPIVLLVILLLAAAVVGSYWYGNRKAAAPSKKQSSVTTGTTQQKTESKPVATKHYDSEPYTLGFDYPENWTVSDTPARLNVQSPVVQLTASDGSKTNARAVVSIQNRQTTVAGYPADGAVAVVTSDKLSYKKPTEIQRAQTYLSYLSYSATKGLDRLFLTGDNGYQQGQLVPMSDVARSNPLVSVAFVTCTTNECAVGESPKYATLQQAAWQSSAPAKQVVALLESLQFN